MNNHYGSPRGSIMNVQHLGLMVTHKVVYRGQTQEACQSFVQADLDDIRINRGLLIDLIQKDAVRFASKLKDRDEHHVNKLLISIVNDFEPSERNAQIWIESNLNWAAITPDKRLLAPNMRGALERVLGNNDASRNYNLPNDMKTYFYDKYFLGLSDPEVLYVKEGMTVLELKQLLAGTPNTMTDGRNIVIGFKE